MLYLLLDSLAKGGFFVHFGYKTVTLVKPIEIVSIFLLKCNDVMFIHPLMKADNY